MAIAQFSGLASGIDSAALIDAIIEAREVQNDIRREEISHLESENDALAEINTKLLALYDLIEPFRTASGGGVSKKASSSDTTVATAAVGASATNSTISLDITSMADSATQSLYYSTGYSSTTEAFSKTGDGSGTLTVTVGTGTDEVTIDVAVTEDSTSVQDVVNSINNDADASGRVVAAAVNTGTAASPNYQIVVSTLQSGTAKGSLSIDATDFGANVNKSVADPATDAVFSIDGIFGSITRSSNSISDVLPNVTLQIVSTGSATITVSDDEDTTADRMSEIIDAYNDLVEYINDNDIIERVEESDEVDNIYGSLAKTRVDNDFLAQFRADLASASSDNGTAVTGMAELGISTNRDGTLTFDIDDFKEAVTSDPLGAGEVLRSFADKLGGVSGSIYQFTKYQGFIDTAEATNNSTIEDLNEAIDQLDRRNAKTRESLERQFANLESVVGRLQSQQSALSGVLASM